MSKINKPLLAVLGLMFLFSLCNYAYAQESQSQCNGGCAKQTFNMTDDQTEKLLGPDSPANLTSDQIGKLLESNESLNMTGYKSEAVGMRDSPRYKAIVTIKSDQTKLKYLEKDLNLTGGLRVIILAACHQELSNRVLPLQLEKERGILYVKINFDGPCDLIWIMLFGSDAEILHARKNLTDLCMTIEISREQHHKKPCLDDYISQPPMVYTG